MGHRASIPRVAVDLLDDSGRNLDKVNEHKCDGLEEAVK